MKVENKKLLTKKISLTFLFLLVIGGGVFWFTQVAQGVNRTWDGGGVDGTCGGAGTANNWACAANWSGDTAPTASDVAIFDATSTKDATIAANVSVAGITISAGYTGTITQSSTFTVTVGASHYSQADGTFTGGSGAITINGTYTLSGGTFTSTSGTLLLSSGTSSTPFTVSGGTFNHGSGTVNFSPNGGCGSVTATADVVTSLTLYNIVVNGAASCGGTATIAAGSGDTIIVANDFTHTDGLINGIWEVQGNVIIGSGADGGAGTLTMTGTGSKTYTYTASGTGPHLRINNAALSVSANTGTTALKTANFSLLAGTFTAPTGVFEIGRTAVSETFFTVSGGTFLHNSGTVKFVPSNSCSISETYTVDVVTSLTLYNIVVQANPFCSLVPTVTTASGDTLIAANDFTHTDGVLGGTLEVQGNVIIESTADGGSGTLTMTGTGSKTYTYTASGTGSHLRINNAALTVSANTGTTALKTANFSLLAGTFTAPTGVFEIGKSAFSETIFTVSGGTFHHNSGTVKFVPSNSCTQAETYTVDVVTSLTLYNIIVQAVTFCLIPTVTTASGDTLIAANDFTHTDGVLNGTWEAQGNVTIGSGADGGTAILSFTGGNNQTYTDQGGNEPDGDVTINKSGGTVTLASNTDWNAGSQDLTITAGTLFAPDNSISTTTLSVGASGALSMMGSQTLTLGGTLTNSGTVKIWGSGVCGGGDNALIRSSSGGTQRSWTGAGTFTLYDANIQDQGGSAAITVYSSTSTSGNGGNWTFSGAACPATAPAASVSSGVINVRSGSWNVR